jgi:hypothetical protein
MAAPEKALLDMFYFVPNADDREVLNELRLNAQHIRSVVQWRRLADYVNIFASPKVEKAALHLKEILDA